MSETRTISTTIKEFEYEEDRRVLTIHFLSGGVYQYVDVPMIIAEQLSMAPSQGKFFHANIKNKFEHLKVRTD